MRVLVNALSVGALSGQHVLYGHLKQLAPWTRGEHEFVVLLNQRAAQPQISADNVEWALAPSQSTHWIRRSLWESISLPRWMS